MTDLFPLAPGEVHVWRAALTQPPEFLARFARALSPAEHERAARFGFDTHRARFVASRCIQRDVLSRYTGIAAADLAFSYSPHGKPNLGGAASSSGLCFNVSNSGDLAVYAVCRKYAVGVDIEAVRPVRNAMLIAERFFSPNEIATLEALSAEERERAFLSCWARREAYVKALGETLWSQIDPSGGWPIHALDLGPQYVGALVVQASEPLTLRGFEWSTPLDGYPMP